jgi:hypothetical protein
VAPPAQKGQSNFHFRKEEQRHASVDTTTDNKNKWNMSSTFKKNDKNAKHKQTFHANDWDSMQMTGMRHYESRAQRVE